MCSTLYLKVVKPFKLIFSSTLQLMAVPKPFEMTHSIQSWNTWQKYLKDNRLYSLPNDLHRWTSRRLPKCFLTACVLFFGVISFLTLCSGVHGLEPGQVSPSHWACQLLKSSWGQWLTRFLFARWYRVDLGFILTVSVFHNQQTVKLFLSSVSSNGRISTRFT